MKEVKQMIRNINQLEDLATSMNKYSPCRINTINDIGVNHEYRVYGFYMEGVWEE